MQQLLLFWIFYFKELFWAVYLNFLLGQISFISTFKSNIYLRNARLLK